MLYGRGRLNGLARGRGVNADSDGHERYVSLDGYSLFIWPICNATTGALSTTCTSSQLSGVLVERVRLGLSPVMNKSRSSFESFIDLSQGRRGSGTKASEGLKHKGKSKTDS